MIANVKDLSPIIRDMRQSDLPAITAIERDTYEYPWSNGIFRDCLLAGYTSVVLERDGEVIGYGIMSERAPRFATDRIFIAVRPSNKPAFDLYHTLGFKVVGVRERYYKARRGNEDAVVLVYHFGDSH